MILANKSLTLKCYEQLETWILTGDLLPGTRLKIEDFKAELNVSGSAIREALSQLTASGLVERQDKRGFIVSSLNEEEIRDLFTTYTDIECLLLTKSIEEADESWEAEVVKALYSLKKVEETPRSVSYWEWEPKNTDFHTALVSGCRSKRLFSLHHNLAKHHRRYCRIGFDLSNQKLSLNHQEHASIAAAALDRNIEKATELLKDHFSEGARGTIATLKNNNII